MQYVILKQTVQSLHFNSSYANDKIAINEVNENLNEFKWNFDIE